MFIPVLSIDHTRKAAGGSLAAVCCLSMPLSTPRVLCSYVPQNTSAPGCFQIICRSQVNDHLPTLSLKPPGFCLCFISQSPAFVYQPLTILIENCINFSTFFFSNHRVKSILRVSEIIYPYLYLYPIYIYIYI